MIVASIAGDRNDTVESERHLLHLQNVHSPSFHDRAGNGTQDIRILVQSLCEVPCVDTHCLLTHGRLVGITRRLIVVRQRDRGCHLSKDQARVNLVVSVRLHLITSERNSQGLCLRWVNVINAGLGPLIPA